MQGGIISEMESTLCLHLSMVAPLNLCVRVSLCVWFMIGQEISESFSTGKQTALPPKNCQINYTRTHPAAEAEECVFVCVCVDMRDTNPVW